MQVRSSGGLFHLSFYLKIGMVARPKGSQKDPQGA